MIANPGPISREDALKYFNIVQRENRKIGRFQLIMIIININISINNRVIHPENVLNTSDRTSWKHGSGGWGMLSYDLSLLICSLSLIIH